MCQRINVMHLDVIATVALLLGREETAGDAGKNKIPMAK